MHSPRMTLRTISSLSGSIICGNVNLVNYPTSSYISGRLLIKYGGPIFVTLIPTPVSESYVIGVDGSGGIGNALIVIFNV
jgi:hypothetical protein